MCLFISLLIHLKVLKEKHHVPLVFLMDRTWFYQGEAHTSPWVLPAVLNDLSLPSSALTTNCNSQKQLLGCWNMPWSTLGSWWVVVDNCSLCLMLSHFSLNSVTLFLLCVGKEGHKFLFWALNVWEFSEKLFWWHPAGKNLMKIKPLASLIQVACEPVREFMDTSFWNSKLSNPVQFWLLTEMGQTQKGIFS